MERNSAKHAIAIFVKTPGLSPIKTRLAEGIGADSAAEFYRLSINSVREVVKEAVSTLGDELTPFWAVAEDKASAKENWNDFEVIHQRGDSLGERLHHIFSVLKPRFDSVIFIGGDAPQITSELIAGSIINAADIKHVKFGPASDGGFYLFSSNSLIEKDVWLKPVYSTADTLSQLRSSMIGHHTITQIPNLTDVDSAKDLLPLRLELEGAKRLVPSQKKLLEWLSREPNVSRYAK